MRERRAGACQWVGKGMKRSVYRDFFLWVCESVTQCDDSAVSMLNVDQPCYPRYCTILYHTALWRIFGSPWLVPDRPNLGLNKTGHRVQRLVVLHTHCTSGEP